MHNKKLVIKAKKYGKYFLYASLLVCGILAILVTTLAYTNNIEDSSFFHDEHAESLNDNWFYTNNQGEIITCRLPLKADDITSKTFTISRRLPRVLPSPTVIGIKTCQQSIKVSYNGTVIYEYGTNSNRPFGSSNGSIWNVIRVPQEAAGTQLDFEFSTSYNSSVGVVSDAFIGTKVAILYRLFKQYGLIIIFTVVLMLLALVLIVLYFALRNLYQFGADFAHIGLFIGIISLWLFGETKITQFMLVNNFMINNLVAMSLMLTALPALQYCNYTQNNKYKPIYDGMSALLMLNFIISVILQLANVYDFYQMKPVTHILICISAVVAITLSAIYTIKYRKLDSLVLLCSLVIIMSFGIVELVNFYSFNTFNTGSYLTVGMLISAVLMTAATGIKLTKYIQKSNDAEYYKQLATTDLLTKTLNRNAYSEHTKILSSEIYKYSGLTLISLDLNYLKLINDNMGHSVGDTALNKCATLIDKTFGHYGTCYRIGGDEFAVIIPSIEAAFLNSLVESFQDECKAIAQDMPYPFEVAIGYAVCDAMLDDSIDMLFKRADASMYNCKIRQKNECKYTEKWFNNKQR